jgi:hypothetical protein
VHRDLKPANIHVLANNTVKIMDFGLARLGESEITRTGTVMGTPNYMSPEQVRGEKVDSRSDIFSLGAVMYEVLTGHRAFEADSMHSVLYQVLDQQPAPLRQAVPTLPLPVAHVVEKALHKDPRERYQAAGEMRAELRAARHSMGPGRAGSSISRAPSLPHSGEETSILPGSSPSHAPAPTFVSTSAAARGWAVRGATALELKPRAEKETAQTARPERTVLEAAPEDGVEEAPSRTPWIAAGAAVALAAGVVGGAWWWRSRAPEPVPGAVAQAPDAHQEALREQLVASQVELARSELDNKNYAGAVAQADRVLALDPGNAAAREVRGRAEAALADLEKAAQEARAAFGRGDAAGASRALRRVMAIDPAHPAANELKAALNQHFKAQAEDARAGVQGARSGAQQARAQGQEAFAAAERQSAAADGLFREGQFTEATQRYLEAADSYARARRAAEAADAAARRAAAAPPSAPPSRPPSASPTAANGGTVAASGPATADAPPPTVFPVTPALPQAQTATPVPAPPTTTPPPAAAAETAIRRVLADYVRAVETKDLGLFKSVWPGLSAEMERSLRDSFRAVKSQEVALSVQAIEVNGSSARVRISRLDTINGQAQGQARVQTFVLAQRGGAWMIDSIRH